MALGSKNRQRSTPERKPWFLGFGFHKLTVEDFDIRTFEPKNDGDPEGISLTLKGRTESIAGFKGHEDADYQKVSFSPFFMMSEVMDQIMEVAALDEEGKDMPEKGDRLWRAYLTYKSFTTMAIICDHLGLGEQYDAIAEPTVYGSLKKIAELIQGSGAYAWYALTEKDSKNPKTGKVYSNVGINWDMVYSVDEIEAVELSADGSKYDVQPKGAAPFSYEKNKYTYNKLESVSNDSSASTPTAAPNMPNMGSAMPTMGGMPSGMPGGAPAGMADGDLPF